MDYPLSPAMEAVAKAKKGNWSFTQVAGTKYRNRDGSSRQRVLEDLNTGQTLRLAPEPDNPIDPCAIGVQTTDARTLGYLPHKIAKTMTRELARGAAFECYLLRVQGSRGHFRAELLLLKYDAAWMARPEIERKFELAMDKLAFENGGRWTYIRIAELAIPNQDGSDRIDHIKKLEILDQLGLVADIQDPEKATKIYVTDGKESVIGRLGKSVAQEVIAGAASGLRYAAFFRDWHDGPEAGFVPYIALLRLGREASAAAIAKGRAG